MAADDFARSLQLVLVDEGGLDDDPNDHGGRTAHGVTQREYDAWRLRKGMPKQDVWKILPDEVTEIFHDGYWEPWCDKLPAGMDYAYFDFNANAGVGQATRTLQRVLKVNVDGVMGPITLKALDDRCAGGIDGLIHEYCDARRVFYHHLAQFPRYGRGWLARTDHVEHSAVEIAATGQSSRNGLDDELKRQATARANPDDTVQPPVQTNTAGATAASSGVLASVVEKLHGISDQLSTFQGTFRFIEYACCGIAVISAAFMVYGMFHDAKVQRAVA